ncbi:MAG: transcription antitermination factor NusB [Bacilli bacterium]|nr:transcription antitermination factor NusB [Bacilli bacterium]MDY4052062.1 transcription antitermination factor NusB [Bacilli bacterium]
MKRHNARILSVMVVFNLDMNKAFTEVVSDELLEETINDVNNLILDDEYKVEIDEDYSRIILNFVIKNYQSIVDTISSSLVGWTIDRLSYVDRAIMICACAELMLKDTPKEVIINEYLEITKEYSSVEDTKQVKFNNRVLDSLGKKIYE